MDVLYPCNYASSNAQQIAAGAAAESNDDSVVYTTKIAVRYVIGDRRMMPYSKPDTHPLVNNISDAAKLHPLTSGLLDSAHNEYLLKIAKITNMDEVSNDAQTERFFPKPSAYINNTMRWPQRRETLEINNSDKDLLLNTFKSHDAVQILNWIALVSLYLKHNNIRLEQFQKIMMIHMILFSASTKVPDHMHILERIMVSYFGIDIHNRKRYKNLMSEYRKQLVVLLCPRRMGKTLLIEIILAAGALSSKTKFAYFSHHGMLCNEVKTETKNIISKMYSLIQQLPSEHRHRYRTCLSMTAAKSSPWIRLKFRQGPDVEIPFLTLGNKDVSIGIKIRALLSNILLIEYNHNIFVWIL